jgi:hypothetical protein
MMEQIDDLFRQDVEMMTMSDIDDLFRQPLDSKSRDELDQISHRKWEATVVSRLLRFYEVEHMAPFIKNLCRERTGKGWLLFVWFLNVYPSFPVWLGFRRVKYLHQLTMDDFLNRFSKTQVFTAYNDVVQEAPEEWLEAGKPVGLVFEQFHGMGATILTDCERPMADEHTRLVKKFRNKEFYFEPLQDFLRSLTWTP